MAALNIMIGFPGSGKSSYAKKYLLTNNSVYLSSDDIRIELYGFEDQTHNDVVFETMKKRTLNALRDGKDVIYDATNLSKKRRSGIIKLNILSTHVEVLSGIAALIFIGFPSDVFDVFNSFNSSSSAILPV